MCSNLHLISSLALLQKAVDHCLSAEQQLVVKVSGLKRSLQNKSLYGGRWGLLWFQRI